MFNRMTEVKWQRVSFILLGLPKRIKYTWTIDGVGDLFNCQIQFIFHFVASNLWFENLNRAIMSIFPCNRCQIVRSNTSYSFKSVEHLRLVVGLLDIWMSRSLAQNWMEFLQYVTHLIRLLQRFRDEWKMVLEERLKFGHNDKSDKDRMNQALFVRLSVCRI